MNKENLLIYMIKYLNDMDGWYGDKPNIKNYLNNKYNRKNISSEFQRLLNLPHSHNILLTSEDRDIIKEIIEEMEKIK